MGFGKDGKGVILYDKVRLTLSTLASGTVIAAASGITLSEDFRILKAEILGSTKGMTADEGGVVIGLADGELSDAEVAECLNSRPGDRNDNLANEQAMRPVFPFDIVFENQAGGDLMVKEEIKPRWTFSNADGWQWFAFNIGSGALTTGTVIDLFVKIYGVWVT